MTDRPSDRDSDKVQQQVQKPEELSSSESAAPRWVQVLSVGVVGMLVVGFFLFPTVDFGAFFSLFGLLILGFAVNECVSTVQLKRRGVSTDGIVVGFDEKLEEQAEDERKYSITIGFFTWSFGPKAPPRVDYFPRVEFEAKDHGKRVFTSEDSSRKPRYRVGEHVRVLYDPARPQVARINKHLWGPMLVAAVIGAFCLVLGLKFLLVGLHVLPGEIHWE